MQFFKAMNCWADFRVRHFVKTYIKKILPKSIRIKSCFTINKNVVDKTNNNARTTQRIIALFSPITCARFRLPAFLSPEKSLMQLYICDSPTCINETVKRSIEGSVISSRKKIEL
jgi:hypothetical protein